MRNEKNLDQENYLQSLYPQRSERGEEARKAARDLGVEGISLRWSEAQILFFFVQLFQCEKFVEIGTLTGFSALAILSGLSEKGQLWSFEKDENRASLAQSIVQKFIQGSEKKFHLQRGDAAFELEKIQSSGPFDGIFIDGNKAAYGIYLDWAEKNVRKGGLIVADNIFLSGTVWGEPLQNFSAKQIEVMRAVNKILVDPRRYLSCPIPTSEGLFVAKKLF